MASTEEPAMKKLATESSFDFRLCLLCQGDKFTNIKSSCDNQNNSGFSNSIIGIVPTIGGMYTT